MDKKSRMRFLAILLLFAASVLAILILLLHFKSTPPQAPNQQTVLSDDQTKTCNKIVDLKPGRKFVGFGITEIHAVGLDAFFVTQPMGLDETPRELVIEKARVSLNDVECFIVIREHKQENPAGSR